MGQELPQALGEVPPLDKGHLVTIEPVSLNMGDHIWFLSASPPTLATPMPFFFHNNGHGATGLTTILLFRFDDQQLHPSIRSSGIEVLPNYRDFLTMSICVTEN